MTGYSGPGGPSLPIAESDVTGLVAALAAKGTLPIAESDVTGLVAALAGKAALPIAESDVTGLLAALAAKADAAATAAALALLAPLSNPTFTGVATAPSLAASGKTGATAQLTTLAGGTASAAPTTGAHVVGEIVADALGRLWYCTTAGTPGTWVLGGPPGIIGLTAYNPGTNLFVSNATTVAADADAANLVVGFTGPPSGKVLVKLSCLTDCTTAAGGYMWNLRDGGGDIPNTEEWLTNYTSSIRYTSTHLVTGLVAGTAYSWKWGHRVSATVMTGNLRFGKGTPPWGPAIMEVWAVNL